MEQTIPINLLNIYDNTSEECMICREELTCQPCYTLPECKHTYHTSCLVNWFRNGDNRCPYCGNKGINNNSNNDNYSSYGFFGKTEFDNQSLKQNKSSYQIYKEKIKTEPVLYSESRKTLKDFRNNNYKIDKQIRLEKYKLINNSYIIPLIIPSHVNIH